MDLTNYCQIHLFLFSFFTRLLQVHLSMDFQNPINPVQGAEVCTAPTELLLLKLSLVTADFQKKL